MIAPQDGIGYHELAELLRGQILGGTLAPGARFPSETDLGQTYGCGRHTVRRAVAVLREEGLIVVRHGRPTRVRERPPKTDIRVQRGAVLEWRPALTDEERERYGPGVVLIDYHGQVEPYAGDLHRFVYR